MNKVFYFISCLTVISALFLISLVLFWEFYPYKVIEFTNTPHKIINQTVKAGDHVSFVFEYCKPQNFSGDLTISFVDGFIYNTSTVKSNIASGCHKEIYQVYVPKGIPVGVYKISAFLSYKVNPIRTIDIVTETEKFTVTK